MENYVPLPESKAIIDELNTIRRQSGLSFDKIASASNGELSPSTVQKFFSLSSKPLLRTVVVISNVLGCKMRLETAQSRAAVSNSDISAYRQMVSERDSQIDKLLSMLEQRNETISSVRETLTAKEAHLAEAHETLLSLRSELKAEKRLHRILLFSVLLALAVVVAALLIIDFRNSSIGFFYRGA